MRVIVGSAQIADAVRNFLVCRAARTPPDLHRPQLGLPLRGTRLSPCPITPFEIIERTLLSYPPRLFEKLAAFSVSCTPLNVGHWVDLTPTRSTHG